MGSMIIGLDRDALSRGALTLLYGATGIVVGGQALSAIVWVVWGRPPHPTELAALLGSAALVVAALVTAVRPRRAAVIALAGAVASWPMYGLAFVDTVRISLESQRLTVIYLRWEPGPGSLIVDYASDVVAESPSTPFPIADKTSWSATGGLVRLSASDIDLLRQAGVSGRVIETESRTIGSGPPARAMIVASGQVPRRIELPQPFRTTVVYVQGSSGDVWVKAPDTAPTLTRTIRLERATHTDLHTWDSIEMDTGGRVGGTAFIWRSPGSSR